MYSSFGSIIKKLRTQKKISQKQLAKICMVSCQAVSKWETGGGYPDIMTLPIIADYFGVTVDYLLGHGYVRKCQR